MTKPIFRAFLPLIAALFLTGCDQPKSAKPGKDGDKKAAKKDDAHEHGAGLHGGAVMDFGNYHAEFTVDHGKKTATIYILDGAVKKPVPLAVDKLLLSIKSPQFQVEMKPDPQKGDPKGKSSRFVAVHDALGKEQEFEGTVTGTIDGKKIEGAFKEEEDN
jgi:hypothetical protein